jgi:hypothetical protein
MLAWNPTWKPGTLPHWMQAFLERHAAYHLLRRGNPSAWFEPIMGIDYVITRRQTRCFLGNSSIGRPFFDHWGTVRVKHTDFLVTQPYKRDDDFAQYFADQVDLLLQPVVPAPWHPEAHLYMFKPTPRMVALARCGPLNP